MICLVSFLVLNHYFNSCLSWRIQVRNTEKFIPFQNIRKFKMYVKKLKWDQDLEQGENLMIINFHENATRKELKRYKKSLKTFPILVDYSHYKNLISTFGNLLFDKEINKHQILSITFRREMESLKMSWGIIDQTNSTRLAIENLLKKHFYFLFEHNYQSYFSKFKITFSSCIENVEIKDEEKVFKK